MLHEEPENEGNFLWRSINSRDSPVRSFFGRHFRGEGVDGREIYLTDITTNVGPMTAVLSVDGTETEIYSSYSTLRPHPIEAFDFALPFQAKRRMRSWGFGNLVKDHQGGPWAYDLAYPGAGRAIYWADGETWPVEHVGTRMRVLHSEKDFTEYIPVWRNNDVEKEIAVRLTLSDIPSEDRVVLTAAFLMLGIRVPNYRV